MMKRATMQTVAVLLGCLMLATQAGAQARSFVPGDTYVECISYRQLGETDDFPGMWEYVYDVVGSTDAGGVNHSWTRDVYLTGFDGTQVANTWASDGTPGGTLLKHNWCAHSAEVPWQFGYFIYYDIYPSYWQDTDGDSQRDSWVLPEPSQPNYAWAMVNEWHDGSEYLHGNSLWQDGIVDENGLTWANSSPVLMFSGLDGLLMTFRIVHPEAPGVVEWATYHNYTIGDAITVVGTTVGPIPEPATLFVMGCGAIGLLRRRRRA